MNKAESDSSTAQSVEAGRPWAWLELARASNLPTILSNVMTGCGIGMFMGWGSGAIDEGSRTFPWMTGAIIFAAIAMHYTAGMMLNDVADAAVDAQERPNRPIPSGRVNKTAAIVVILILFAAGLGILIMQRFMAAAGGCLLVVFIVLYDLLHTKSAFTVILLGLCRAMVYVIAAMVISKTPPIIPLVVFSGCLAAYVIILSVIARNEATKPSRRRIVIKMLQGISMVDAVFLLLLGQTIAAVVAVACYAMTIVLHKRIAGT